MLQLFIKLNIGEKSYMKNGEIERPEEEERDGVSHGTQNRCKEG